MKVLSVKQPWAWLLVSGEKDIENRSRKFHYRGTLLIHASATPDKDALRQFVSDLQADGVAVHEEDFVNGAIIGSVVITDCVDNHASDWFHGPFGLVCADAQEFDEPIPAKGKLGLWDYEWPR